MAPLDRAADPNSFSRAAADGADVARREAFGVRQLAAAFSLCPNNVSVPISSEGFLHRLRRPRIGTTNNLRVTPQSGAKTQTMSLSPYLRSLWICLGRSLHVLNQLVCRRIRLSRNEVAAPQPLCFWVWKCRDK
ncbi:MAG: hypothetical protein GX456_02865 [Verrucomicrobia bacterium]|nr:hypothetical protein [Verrucomicrobiota bacterium]